MATRQKAIKWDDPAVKVAQDTDFFPEDVKGRSDRPSEDIINMLLDDDARVNVFFTHNGITKGANLNDGQKISQNVPFQVRLFLYPGMTYNFQHTNNGDVNVAMHIVTEVVS